MKINILTLFPKMFEGPLTESVMWRAMDKKFVEFNIVDLRQFGDTKRRNVDDRPYGGGAGMIIRVDVIDSALKSLITSHLPAQAGKSQVTKVVLLDATGEKFTQKKAFDYSKLDELTLICGHYEGVDHRVHEHLVDDVISIGDYVLTGGEIPAMVIADSVTRLIPKVIKPESLLEESFSPVTCHLSPVTSTEEYPQYTRPPVYKGWKVPEILLTGDHKKIANWRKGE